MKRRVIVLLALMAAGGGLGLRAQQWTLDQPEGLSGRELRLAQQIPVDGGASVLGVGWTTAEGRSYEAEGFVMKVNRDGDYTYRAAHEPGMWLAYQCASQLADGNYAVFGVGEDSLSNLEYGHYLCVDILDTLLRPVSSRRYHVDTAFGYFEISLNRERVMSSMPTDSGTVLLATCQSRLVGPNSSHPTPCLCVYEFDASGDTLRAKAVREGNLECQSWDIKCLTRSPSSGNVQVFLGKGVFSGSDAPGFKTLNRDFEVVGSKGFHTLPGAQWYYENMWSASSDGRWDSEGHMIISAWLNHATDPLHYLMLYKIDTLGHKLGEVRLPPVDSSIVAVPSRNIAYANDSTLFVITMSGMAVWDYERQVNVTLVDDRLNLLGRRVFKREGWWLEGSAPAVFDDGGCLVPLTLYAPGWDGNTCLLKLTRDDIEITWDVLQDNATGTRLEAYPNPVLDRLHIPTRGFTSDGTRLRIADAGGVTVFDAPLETRGDAVALNVSNLAPGMYVYYIVAVEGRTVASGKFMKE